MIRGNREFPEQPLADAAILSLPVVLLGGILLFAPNLFITAPVLVVGGVLITALLSVGTYYSVRLWLEKQTNDFDAQWEQFIKSVISDPDERTRLIKEYYNEK